jgi:hypothetical protein
VSVTACESSILGFSIGGAVSPGVSSDVRQVQAPETASVQEAFQLLSYNQQLIQLADSKAGNLIVINSLFIAAMQSQGAQTGWGLAHLVQTAYVLISCLAVLACLRAISTRAHASSSDRKDFIFFKDILSRGNAGRYIRDFRAASPDFQLDSTLRRTFVLAEIAQKKFEVYSLAQRLTIWAAVAWVSSHALSVLAP